MSSHHDNHDNHSNEPKTVAFATPMILGCVALLAILLLVSTCDKKHGGHDSEASHEGHNKMEDSVFTEGHDAKAKTEVVVEPQEVDGAMDSLGNYIYNTGEIQKEFTPDGTEIVFGKNSTEAKLMSFLSNKDAMVDTLDQTKGWLSLDRVYFEKGKAVLTKESLLQIKNLGIILNTYPTAMVKIGGYTDNTGAEAVNIKVSGERAAVVLKELAKVGIDASHLKSEGYGPMHPIASNDTPEGMAQNRRVDIRITKK